MTRQDAFGFVKIRFDAMRSEPIGYDVYRSALLESNQHKVQHALLIREKSRIDLSGLEVISAEMSGTRCRARLWSRTTVIPMRAVQF